MTTSAYRMRRDERRGVILILVLGVLGLMAVIGVTFATFTGQSRVASRNFAQAKLQFQTEELIDFALGQLICDTNDTRSAIRGHSLARDMYGNDSARNGHVETQPDGSPLYIRRADVHPTLGAPLYNLTTSVVSGDPTYYGFDFRRWTIRVRCVSGFGPGATGAVDQSFEVVDDSGFAPGSTDPRILTVVVTQNDANAEIRHNGFNPRTGSSRFQTNTPARLILLALGDNLANRFPFTLDGRWLNAFNGPGRASEAKFANFRYNFDLTPSLDMVGMDEDYDAVDLENWFLAMQSADGQVVIPSFHRPANVRYEPGYINDWDGQGNLTVRRQKLSRILRPRQIDGHDAVTFPDLIPGPDGKIRYDVDNDGDGVTDSVWVDLGYPARRNAQGRLVKPLFAFMVIGLNGRIPLNTAGNLAGRLNVPPGGASPPSESFNATHASHLGNSVSEIDPTYGLQNALNLDVLHGDQVDNAGVDVRLTQLRNLLAGTRPQPNPRVGPAPAVVNGDANFVVMGRDNAGDPTDWYYMPNGIADAGDLYDGAVVLRRSEAVPGRWGEPEAVPGGEYAPLGVAYQNEVRPGYSISVHDLRTAMSTSAMPVPFDAADDDYNSFDVWPPAGPDRLGEIGDLDFYDGVGALVLPVERMRRFLTPVDLNGSGSVVRWNSRGASSRRGGDRWGRVEYRGYYRPPGLPVQIAFSSGNFSSGHWTAGNAYPSGRAQLVSWNDRTTHTSNILHGFESFLNPNTRGTPHRSGGMLAYRDGTQPDGHNDKRPGVPTQIPTYDGKINSGLGQVYTYQDVDPETGVPVDVSVESRSDGLNEADELNLYNPNPNLDSPFSHADLEWLYRSHDVDGHSLNSRLASLAPISFTNNLDGLRRRRLYSIDTWESNSYAWANDNPSGVFSANRRFTSPLANASMSTLDTSIPRTWDYTPGLAQRGRKINLNMPLPLSNNPKEPIRLKWIEDAYTLLKTVLPPRAVDTPEELAQLGQFLVNVIDFRDPDCTATIWTNPDVNFVPVGQMTPTNQLPVLTFRNGAPATSWPLVHYGMEFNPVAINEVLAYSYPRKDAGNPVDTGRFFIELVNTLTKPKTGTIDNNAGQINLSGFSHALADPYASPSWDLVFTEDGPGSRPDPFTGQLQRGATLHSLTPLGRNSFTTGRGYSGTGGVTNGIILNPLPSRRGSSEADLFGDQQYFGVIGNSFPGTGEQNTETVPFPPPGNASNPGDLRYKFFELRSQFDPVNPTAVPTTPTLRDGVLPPTIDGDPLRTFPPKIVRTPNEATHYWVCLRRPANPLAAVSVDNPMIVVDSMRFPIIDTGGTARTEQPDPNDPNRVDVVNPQGTNDIYSLQRHQPYRGGQAVPRLGTTAGNIDPRYGYTEQIAIPVHTDGSVVNYGTAATQKTGSQGPQVSRGSIYHTLGRANDGTVNGINPVEYWDHFVFHDRDFTSPYELTLVPGCPPGLFTKQFAEFAPSARNLPGFQDAARGTLTTTLASVVRPGTIPTPSTPAAGDVSSMIANDRASQPFHYRAPVDDVYEPHSNPYLPDRFFYTGANPTGTTDVLEQTVGGYAADGWFKMFEFFEVPTQSNGAIGLVADGTNFDWARQDVRPGMLNLNLIIDEEVFLALLGKQNMADPTFLQQLMNPYSIMQPMEFDETAFVGGVWPGPLPTGYPALPMVVTASLGNRRSGRQHLNGAPAYAYPMTSLGTVAPDPTRSTLRNRMKAAFAQFLWARHGGSGFLFAYGEGATGQNMTVTPPVMPVPTGGNAAFALTEVPIERPFRSASYPDIDQTVLRPAALPPSPFTDPPLSTTAADPGVRNRVRFPGYNRSNATMPVSTPAANATVLPPPIPARRLFQPPDAYQGAWPSNASVYGDPFINETRPAGVTTPLNTVNSAIGALPPMSMVAGGAPVNITDGAVNLFIPHFNHPTTYPYPEVELGRGGSGGGGGGGDSNMSQHPYFRSETMQRVLNLSTVRTHQFAVWITVGIFEVVREGDIAMIDSNFPNAAFDVLGPEVGAATGENIRYRSFFVVDRLKLTGFDPDSAGSYKPAVLYRRTIQ